VVVVVVMVVVVVVVLVVFVGGGVGGGGRAACCHTQVHAFSVFIGLIDLVSWREVRLARGGGGGGGGAGVSEGVRKFLTSFIFKVCEQTPWLTRLIDVVNRVCGSNETFVW